MTILATMLHREFVLSVADRRSVVQRGNKFEPQDEKFNKHIAFALADVRGTATYSGFAKWKRRNGKYVTTDEVVADALSEAANRGNNLGTALHRVAVSLAKESNHIRSMHPKSLPMFTVVFAGYTRLFAEPWIAVVTDQEYVPAWVNEEKQAEVSAPEPFRIYFAVPSKACVCINGYTSALPPKTTEDIEYLLSVPGVQAYDVANLAVSRIRKASSATLAVGSRVSAIVFPAHGWVDTGLWVQPREPLAAAMPRMVYPDGRQWSPSEVILEFEKCGISRFQRHSLLYQALLDSRISVRWKRRLRRTKSGDLVAPTVYQLIGLLLFPNVGQT